MGTPSTVGPAHDEEVLDRCREFVVEASSNGEVGEGPKRKNLNSWIAFPMT